MPDTAAPGCQLRIHVSAPLAGVAARVARAFPDDVTSTAVVADARASLLRVRAGIDAAATAAIVHRLRPIPFIVHTDVELPEGTDVELVLGARAGVAGARVEVLADSADVAERVVAELSALGFEPRARLAHVDRPGVRFGGAAELTRALVRWSLAGVGHDLAEEPSLGELDDRIVVAVRDPALEGRSASARYAVTVETDDEAAVAPLVERLRGDGLQVRVVAVQGNARSTFAVDAGAFADAAGGALGKRLVARVEEALRALGFHLDEEPVGLERGRDGILDARVRLPVAAVRARPGARYRGPRPERFEVVVRTDDPALARSLVALLEIEGLRVSGVEALPSDVLAPRVTWPARFPAPLLEVACGSTVREALARAGVGAELPIERRRSGSAEGPRVVIDAPVAALAAPALARRLRAVARKTAIRLVHARGVDLQRVEAALREEGFEVFDRPRVADVDAAVVAHGGASDAIVARAMEALSGLGVAGVGAEQRWIAEDGDVWVHVPFTPGLGAGEDAQVSGFDAADPALIASLVDPIHHDAAFLQRAGQGGTRVGERIMADATPGPELQGGDAARPRTGPPFVLDSAASQIMAAIADAFADERPILLHGPPGTGRRSALRELARWAGARIEHVRLHADTTSSDLLGRWITPRHGDGRWRDGAALRAALQGSWLHLDGVDRADPRVVDALIALLDGAGVDRPGATDEVPLVAATGLRVVATATELPSEASAPWVDRFRRFAVAPLDEAGATELVLGLAGRAPLRVVVGSDVWGGLPAEATYPRLAGAPDLDLIASSIARVHAGVAAAAASPAWRGGARPSRRTIHHALTHLERRGHDAASLRRALTAAYVQGAPSRAIVDLVDAVAPRAAEVCT